MIVGTGIDIVELERIEKILKRQEQAFISRVLTKAEIQQMPAEQARKTEYTAGRFAAKEACSKALGTGIGGVLSFQDIDVLRADNGKPGITVSQEVLAATVGLERCRLHVSISHSRDYAIAQVIVEKL
ncbi:holo-ACP synthase [Aneurinibacillus sp. Ricciae_BoGa-3]|uniref:holo-ACP synthase n=1 Tax=Aneurinibacillus sp. Ricciae_BoGa-3 TaxID=3022697 RepID=UPI00233FF610|nr:holo-ACP synthase [Aneurinibacillus sp. Ricciae_BoGa-3]WCK54986.1 holo-ACP synthase [Aneurinibacillus sp. Ricciae_BoGa-3]